MGNIYRLNKGDLFDNGQSNIQIVDEDRLCYLVKSTSRNAFGIRTISKSLFKSGLIILKSIQKLLHMKPENIYQEKVILINMNMGMKQR